MISKLASNVLKKNIFPFSTAANPQVIMPQWWQGKQAIDESKFVIDCTQYKNKPFSSYREELQKRMNTVYNELGVVLLKNTGLKQHSDMRERVGLVMPPEQQMKYEGGANERKRIEPNVYEVGAPLVAHLHYHHEMAYVSKSVTNLGFICKSTIPDRGATFISENIGVTDSILSKEVGRKLKEKGICYQRRLTDREYYKGNKLSENEVYNHWQQSFLSEDPIEVVQKAKSRGLKCEWGENRLLKTKFYVSAFEYDPFNKRNVIYSSLADDHMWFDGWPGVREVHPDSRPLKLTYGDDSELTYQEKKDYITSYDEHGIKLDWEAGDVGVICNVRFSHGRPGIFLEEGEERELGVILGQTFDRRGEVKGAW